MMGMGLTAIRFFNKSINATLGNIHGCRLAELGDQKLWQIIKVNNNGSRIWAKEWFERQGCHHYSIDIHGRHGSHPLDLSKPIKDDFWHDNFDIVTNFGTSEHVEDQYQCWRNIHNLGRAGCVYIHMVPAKSKEQRGHSKYFYNSWFFKNLARTNNYTLIFNEYIKTIEHYAACYIKPSKFPFCSEKKDFLTWLNLKD